MRRTLLGMFALATATAILAPSSVHAAERPSPATVRAQITELLNAERAKAGCRPLARDHALEVAAQRHTRKMAKARKMSHQLAGEAGLSKRVERAGYRRWKSIGENVAYGYPTARRVMNAWMNSRGHRANILNCRYRDVGIGVVQQKNGTTWYTQDFGRN